MPSFVQERRILGVEVKETGQRLLTAHARTRRCVVYGILKASARGGRVIGHCRQLTCNKFNVTRARST